MEEISNAYIDFHCDLDLCLGFCCVNKAQKGARWENDLMNEILRRFGLT